MQATELEIPPLTKNNEWWLRSPHNVDKINFFEDPVCKLTEHRFIAALLLLLEEKEEITDINELVDKVTIFNSSATQSTKAVAVYKRSIIRPRSKGLNLGAETHLIVTGQLAGSVALRSDVPNTDLFFVNSTPVQTLRPLIPTTHVHAMLDIEINKLKSKKYEDEFSKQIALLVRAQEIIQHYGYMGALFHLLNQLLEIPIDEKSMLHNSRLPFGTTIDYI